MRFVGLRYMTVTEYRCPKCGGSNFKRWDLTHPLILHWVLNPGVAFGEILFGMRVPKLQLICRDCQEARIDRIYVPCPSCRAMHLGRSWSRRRGFGNWRGIACPSCRDSIPCLWNVFSLLFLAVTWPAWFLPYRLYFRDKPLKPIYDSVDGTPPTPKAITSRTWIFAGILLGGCFGILLLPIALLTSSKSCVTTLLYCGFVGFGFSFSMWFFFGRKPRRAARPTRRGVAG